MRAFLERLERAQPSSRSGRRWLYVPYDQLSDAIGPLSREPSDSIGIVLVECAGKAARRPYHRQKLALVLANQRHFALEQAARGVAVDYRFARDSYLEALEPAVSEHGGLEMMAAAERELSRELEPLFGDGIEVTPHEGWLTTAEQFAAAGPAPWRMDRFYRKVRQDTGLLMIDGRPEGGKYSHDADNRKPWRGEPPVPRPPRFRPDDVTLEVGELVRSRFDRHPGRLDLEALPATAGDAEACWTWALEECLEHFGPYEDAMSARSRSLFHTRISPLLNLHRLLPSRVVADVAASAVPLSSREGFVRQVLGWREFVRHVHRETDGFRELPGGGFVPEGGHSGDGGWSGWTGESWAETSSPAASGDGGARPSVLGADRPLPPAFWGEPSGLACLDRVVDEVWSQGYTHHIPRLMVLSNLAALLDVDPRELTDWFWVAFVDAYDWVVEPNVLGMGTHAAGDVMTTKPYVSGANYIHRMSDYCAECRFDPKSNCPVTPLYWAYLARHRERLAGNRRMSLVYGSLWKRSEERRQEDAAVFARTSRALERGERLEPR